MLVDDEVNALRFDPISEESYRHISPRLRIREASIYSTLDPSGSRWTARRSVPLCDLQCERNVQTRRPNTWLVLLADQAQ